MISTLEVKQLMDYLEVCSYNTWKEDNECNNLDEQLDCTLAEVPPRLPNRCHVLPHKQLF